MPVATNGLGNICEVICIVSLHWCKLLVYKFTRLKLRYLHSEKNCCLNRPTLMRYCSIEVPKLELMMTTTGTSRLPRKKMMFVIMVFFVAASLFVFRVFKGSRAHTIVSAFASNINTNFLDYEKDEPQNSKPIFKKLFKNKNQTTNVEHSVKITIKNKDTTSLQPSAKPFKRTVKTAQSTIEKKKTKPRKPKSKRPKMPILPPKYLFTPTNKTVLATRLVLMSTWVETDEKLLVHENVLRTWKLWKPTVTPLLFTNDSMLTSRAKENHWHVLPLMSVTCGEMPIMRDMYLAAMNSIDSVFYSYANSDILLSEEIKQTVKVISELELAHTRPVMLLASRTNVNFSEGPSIEDVSQVRALKKKGWPLRDGSSDVFITNRLFPWEYVPDVVVGRIGIGMWIVSYARAMNVTVIDISKTTTAIHMTTKAGNYESHWKPNSRCNHKIYEKLHIKPPSWRCGFIHCAAMETSYSRQDGSIRLTGRNRFRYDPRCLQCPMNLTSIVF